MKRALVLFLLTAGCGHVEPDPAAPVPAAWQKLTTTPHGAIAVRSIHVAPTNPAVMLAQVWGPEVLRSTDGGATFEHLRMRMPPGTFGSEGTPGDADPEGPFRMHPTDDRVVYAFTQLAESGGPTALLVSTDRGEQFRELSRPRGRQLAIDPKHPQRMYLAYGLAIDRSEDGGATWVEAGTVPGSTPGLGISRLAMSSSGRVFAYLDFGGDGGERGLAVSDDAGGSFRMAVARPFGFGGFGLSTDGAVVYVAVGGEICASRDAGATFACHDAPTVVAPGDPGKLPRKLSGVAFRIDPVDPDVVYQLGRDGIANHLLRSTDGAETWSEIGPAEVTHVELAGQNLFAATTRGLFRSSDAGATWIDATASTLLPRADWVQYANGSVLFARVVRADDLTDRSDASGRGRVRGGALRDEQRRRVRSARVTIGGWTPQRVRDACGNAENPRGTGVAPPCRDESRTAPARSGSPLRRVRWRGRPPVDRRGLARVRRHARRRHRERRSRRAGASDG